MMRRQNQEEERFRDFQELSALVLNIIRFPAAHIESPATERRMPPLQQITPAGLASLLLGVSLSLMLCGSLTFFIGFVLMPWVLGLVLCLYFVGVVSSLTMIGRAIFMPPSPTKHAANSWKLL